MLYGISATVGVPAQEPTEHDVKEKKIIFSNFRSLYFSFSTIINNLSILL